jgi:cob(I)alamin adenosyltransferase
MSIVTTGGDQGITGLSGGKRVPKDAVRVECLGALDELCAFLGDARLAVVEAKTGKQGEIDVPALIKTLQGELYAAAGILAVPAAKEAPGLPFPDEKRIESWIRDLEEAFPVRGFILPGGSRVSAKLDIARTVCRRAERRLVTLDRLEGVPPELLRYMNRLSDLLFMLARKYEAAPGA